MFAAARDPCAAELFFSLRKYRQTVRDQSDALVGAGDYDIVRQCAWLVNNTAVSGCNGFLVAAVSATLAHAADALAAVGAEECCLDVAIAIEWSVRAMHDCPVSILLFAGAVVASAIDTWACERGVYEFARICSVLASQVEACGMPVKINNFRGDAQVYYDSGHCASLDEALL